MSMRRHAVVGLIALAGVGIVASFGDGGGDRSATATGAATPAPPASASLPARQRARLEAAVRAGLRAAETTGVVVGVQTPTGRWVRAIGIADKRTRAPMRPDVHQRIGSVTKTFTAALLMQLVGEGKLSLDDTIGKYIGGVPNGDAITLRQVAGMTSGVASYTKNPAFVKALFANPRRTWRPREVLEIGLRDSPDFPPGTQFEYSNTNFIMLGLVIEQVERKRIGAVLRERIINPLRLKGTSWPGGSRRLPTPHAHGYTLQGQAGDTPVDATTWSTSEEWTAGQLISTVDDLLVYGRATATGRGLLKPAQQRVRLRFPTTPPPLSRPLSYSIGLVSDRGWVGHTGQVPGFTTTMYHHPGIATTVVVEANSDISTGACRGKETLAPDPITKPCANPADRIMGAIARSLGRPYQLPPG